MVKDLNRWRVMKAEFLGKEFLSVPPPPPGLSEVLSTKSGQFACRAKYPLQTRTPPMALSSPIFLCTEPPELISIDGGQRLSLPVELREVAVGITGPRFPTDSGQPRRFPVENTHS